MKNLAYEYVYLGFALASFGNLSIFDWQFHVIIIPFIILESIRNHKE